MLTSRHTCLAAGWNQANLGQFVLLYFCSVPISRELMINIITKLYVDPWLMRLVKRVVRCTPITKMCTLLFRKCWNAILPCFQSGRLELSKQLWRGTVSELFIGEFWTKSSAHFSFPASRSLTHCGKALGLPGKVWTTFNGHWSYKIIGEQIQ